MTSLRPVITSCGDAPLDRMAEQIGPWKLVFYTRHEWLRVMGNKISGQT